MKIRLTLLILLTSVITAFSQVISYRISDLNPEGYSIFGDAFLEELSNGDLQFRLSPDFSTPNGPDVRIFLNNSISISGAVEIANLSTLGHFSGELVVTLPSTIDINQYDFVVFYCFQFNLLWASGEFGSEMTNGFTCEASTVSLSNGTNSADVCPTDGVSDFLTFQNSLSAPVGTNYAYLLTDDNEVLQEVIAGDSYDFEGSPLETQRVYGVHYDGTLNPVIGANRMQTTSTGCLSHSNNMDYVTITKMACPPPFTCEMNTTFGDGGVTTYDICADDSSSDVIELRNSLGLFPNEHYAYLITDNNEVVQEVVTNVQSYDFEGSGPDEERVYGIHYDGDLQPQIGANRLQTTATGCYEHSSSSTFITVTKNACIPPYVCAGSNVSLSNGQSMVSTCPEDGMADSISFDNSLNITDFTHYAYIITDESEVVQSIVMNNNYDFEGMTLDAQRVYGINYDGMLLPQIGQSRLNTAATGCFQHSSTTNYITVLKDACPPVFTCLDSEVSSNGLSMVDICPTDGDSDSITLSNTINVRPGAHFAYLLTDENDVLVEVVLDSVYDFEGSGLATNKVFGIHFDGVLQSQLGANRLQTTASECHIHSTGTLLTVTKEACPPPFLCEASQVSLSNGAIQVTVCTTDNEPDTLTLANSLILTPGQNYAYFLTDTNDLLLEVIDVGYYAVPMSTLEPRRIYGVHFDGDLQPQIGQLRTATTATGCIEHSTGNSISVIMEDCSEPPFECLDNVTATDGWVTSVTICPLDGTADSINLKNNLFIPPGEHYAYLITDTNNVLIEVVLDSVFDFEGSSLDPQRVYGIHYDGVLNIQIGANRLQTTATECFIHSSATTFLTIQKECLMPYECVESLTATHAWVTNVDICVTDNEEDIIFLQNNISTPPGDNYAFLLTDTNEVLQEIILDTIYDFTSTSVETQRVYGMSYDGEITAAIGENRKSTTASNCSIHSGDNLFITINKTAGCATSTDDLSQFEGLLVYPNPSIGQVRYSLQGDEEVQSIRLLDVYGRIIKNVDPDSKEITIEQSGVYYIQFLGEGLQSVKRIIIAN